MFFVCTMLSFNPLSGMYEVLYDDGEGATEPLDFGDKNDLRGGTDSVDASDNQDGPRRSS